MQEITTDYRNARDAQAYRRVQAEELFLRFERAHGRRPEHLHELEGWVEQETAAGRMESPIEPSPEAWERLPR